MTLRGDLAVALVAAFGLGVLVTVLGYDYQEQERVKQTAEAVRKCQAYEGYYVMALDGKTLKCRALETRADWMYPLPKDSVKRRRGVGGQ